MSSDVVVREVLVDAPIDLVWDVVTKPEHVKHWFSETDLQPEAGAEGEFRFAGDEQRPAVVLRAVVDRAIPPHTFELHWTGHPGEPEDDHPWTSVLFKLTSEGDGTRLSVTESGFDAVGLKGVAAENYRQGHERGWKEFIDKLAQHAETTGSRAA
jgi:uncharacterized protein YndB with AHSA1/START domain